MCDENVCIDETMVPFRGRLKFRQYIKGKRHKFGIKLFKLCMSGGYLLHAKIYCGQDKVDGMSVATNIRRWFCSFCIVILNQYLNR
nr:unnamed protein product [Callosobruchus analis]